VGVSSNDVRLREGSYSMLGRPNEFERELIRGRSGERRERAKAQGVKMGRKSKLTDHQRPEAVR
jgi:DNA invertase Pin-like site-specific DNA recombinase